MKKFTILILLTLIISGSGISNENKFAGKHKKKVIEQNKSDIQNRDRILQELNGFLKSSSDRISDGKIKLGVPVEQAAITGIKDTGDFHYAGVIPPKIYGYVNTKTLNMRSEENAQSSLTGKLDFKERVQILFQSEKFEAIGSFKAPWLLIQKNNGDEGWVFGAFISDNIPSSPDSESGKTDWNMVMPASGRLSSRFGNRIDPVTKKRNSFHKGIDISAPNGTPVYAAESGTVTDAGFKKNGYGNLIVIKHGDDLATYYGHLSKIVAGMGKKVNKGELIGNVGSTGKSTGPHLHFEVRKGSQALNPEDFIR
jgi:murein DD-endopeptidase MepM/ murein hydrolase activator NlpD